MFFLRVEAPQIQFNNRDVHNLVLLSKMSSDHQQSGRTPESRLSVLSPAVLETCTVRVRAERRTWRGSLGVHRASQSSHVCLSLVLRVVCCCAHTFHLFTFSTPVCARWMPHRCMREGARNSCVAMVSGAGGVPKVWFPVRPKIHLLTSKRQRLILGRLARYGSRWWGSSSGRRSKSLSETGKKRRATTLSIHLGVPNSLSVTPGNGGIWQQLGWSTVCETSTPTAHTLFSCAFCLRACPLQVTVISSSIDFKHMRGSSTT